MAQHIERELSPDPVGWVQANLAGEGVFEVGYEEIARELVPRRNFFARIFPRNKSPLEVLDHFHHLATHPTAGSSRPFLSALFKRLKGLFIRPPQQLP